MYQNPQIAVNEEGGITRASDVITNESIPFGYAGIIIGNRPHFPQDCIAIGCGADTTKDKGIAIGKNAINNHENSIVIGSDIKSTHDNSIRIGNMVFPNYPTNEILCCGCNEEFSSGIIWDDLSLQITEKSNTLMGLCHNCIRDTVLHHKFLLSESASKKNIEQTKTIAEMKEKIKLLEESISKILKTI